VDVQRSGDWPFYMNLAANPTLLGITASQSRLFGLLIDRGTFTEDRVWGVTSMPYVLTGGSTFDNNIGMVLPADRTLTIQPGVVVKSADEMFWRVNGTLKAQGTAAQPILFTGWRDDTAGGDSFGDGILGAAAPRAGDWENIVFGAGSSASILDYVEVRYAGNRYSPTQSTVYNEPAIVIADGSSVTITHALIRDVRGYGMRIADSSPTLDSINVERSGNWPFYINLGATPKWTNLRASGGLNGILVDRGTLTTDLVWDITTLPYVLTGGGNFDNNINLVIPVDRKLTIKPGVVVKSADELVWIIQGTLDAAGTVKRKKKK